MFIHIENYVASIVITSKSVSKRSRTFITVITQIITFSLNLGIPIRISKQANIPWKNLFERIKNIKKNFFFRNFSEKHCVLTLRGHNDVNFLVNTQEF